MIQSTGNNFGVAVPISFEAYLTENNAVISGKFSIDTTSEEYLKASVLEIYFDDLVMSKSAVSSCYIQASELRYPGTSREEICNVGTVLKAWIKDRNTLCIEKLDIYDDLGTINILFGSMFAKLASKEEMTIYPKTSLKFTFPGKSMTPREVVCVVNENWAFIHMYFVSYGYLELDDPFIMNMTNFPTDISMEIFVVGGYHLGSYPGGGISIGKIENGILTVNDMEAVFKSSSIHGFICAYGVRNTFTPPAEEPEQPAEETTPTE